MKVFKIIFVLSFLLTSCQKEKNSVELKHLNGYWEIVQAQNPYGKNIIYSINTQVDYFEIKDSLGFRKKLKPDLNGNYKTTKALEEFKIINENDSLKLQYKTPYDTWKETILSLNDSLMLIKNEKDFLYTYKRFKPINITE
ncbi:hypothetical protein [Flavobacterium sp. CS20]|jgi:hypothetical protein|uniref:hypothetical protein n=1 Tax=Flavobacterium sp. CS20 TaxID=2775246 RepID=UPI001B3A6547|nr:hypothetical protein [Flavobacterium sp. CS20]QTY27847.1 hypothetical protein IGB25_04860 [Flavobacterium sp. CS20]